MRRFGLVVGFLLALCGCGQETPDSGYVLSKEHRDSWLMPITTCVVYNANGTCAQQMTQYVEIPEVWSICLVDRDRQDFEGCRDTSRELYDRARVGAFWDWGNRS